MDYTIWKCITKGKRFVFQQSGELFHYHSGVFESYPPKQNRHDEYSKYHVIKIILDDVVQVEVETLDDGYRVTRVGDRIQWETVDAREDMELHLLARNKRHLQQVSKEDGIPMQEWFQKLIRESWYSYEGGRILVSNIDWNDIPDNKEI